MITDPTASTNFSLLGPASDVDHKGRLTPYGCRSAETSSDKPRPRRVPASLTSLAKPAHLSEEDNLRAEIEIDALLIAKLRDAIAVKKARLQELCDQRALGGQAAPQLDAIVPSATPTLCQRDPKSGAGPADSPANLYKSPAPPSASQAALFAESASGISEFRQLNCMQAVPTLSDEAYAQIAGRLEQLDAEVDGVQNFELDLDLQPESFGDFPF